MTKTITVTLTESEAQAIYNLLVSAERKAFASSRPAERKKADVYESARIRVSQQMQA